MFKKASVSDLQTGVLTRDAGHIVVAMCHYPRGIAKTLLDEYVKALGPDAKLLAAFLAEKRRLNNHNEAFKSIRYDQRFNISLEGIAHLKRLAGLSELQDVFIVCQCKPDQRCHRELILLLAKKWYGARTELRKFSYPEFERRIPEMEGPLLAL